MARRRLLSEAAQAGLLGLPAAEREVLRYATLGAGDLELVAGRRGEANQRGFALMLVCLRHPGRVLEANEVPHRGCSSISPGNSTWTPARSVPMPDAIRLGGRTSPS